MNVLTFSILCFFGSLAATRAAWDSKPNSGNWPKAEHIRLFVPYDGETYTDDVVYNKKADMCFWPKLRDDLTGPFGAKSTSYGIASSPSYICSYEQGVTVSHLDFTYSIQYYYEDSNVKNAKLNAIFMNDSPQTFSVGFADPDGIEVTSYGDVVASWTNILKPRQWNFLTFVYKASEGKLELYDESGSVKKEVDVTIKAPHFTWAHRFITGLHYRLGLNGTYTNLRIEDALACLFVYNAALTPSEISVLPGVCQTKGKGPPPSTQSTTTSTTTTTTRAPLPTVWPANDYLLGFWPMSYQHKLDDVSIKHYRPTTSSSYLMPTTGPWGDFYTAVKPTVDLSSEGLMSVEDPTLELTSQGFTVSLFFSLGEDPTPKGSGGLFEFIDSQNSGKTFQFRHVNATTLEVAANGVTIGTYVMIQQKGVWTFVAFTWDGSKMTVYSRHGVVAPKETKTDLASSISSNNNGFRLGYASKWGSALKSSDSLACLMIYSRALTQDEVRQAYFSCRIMGGSIPCGAPKLPLSPVPSSTAATATPKQGQFPWIASMRFNNEHVCSATIIDPFWLLSATNCLKASADPSKYEVYVGEHDLNVNEWFTAKHSVEKLLTKDEVALIHLDEPIDFRTDYVNDACWLQSGDQSDLNLTATQFVMGWGKNGRNAFGSPGLPRYVPGSLMSSIQCEQAWNDQFDESHDYCFMSSSSDKNVPCSGDEGSPVLVPAPAKPDLFIGERLVQVGIYYKRDENCTVAKPGLFLATAAYSTWIAEQLACAVPGVVYPANCPQA